MKSCTKCLQVQPLSAFAQRRVARDGLRFTCRACDAAYRAANKDRAREYSAAHYRANRVLRLQQAREWQAAHRDKVRSYAAAWRSRNPERAAQTTAAFRAANPGYQASWRAANPDRVRAAQTAYSKAHPEKARDKAKRRRALVRGAVVEKVELAVLVRRDGGRCGICDKPVAIEERSLDHVLPLSKGGAHTYANTRLAHRSCNTARGNRGAAQLRLVG